MQRQLYARGSIDVGYVGTHGDHLIQPIDINYPQPADVVALQSSVAGSVNPARPYRGYGIDHLRETTARSNYKGLLTQFRHDGGRGRHRHAELHAEPQPDDATNDRDAVDIPQNPLRPRRRVRGRAHRSPSHLHRHLHLELPFFKDANAAVKAVLGGWQVAGHHHAQLGPADVAHPR